MIRYRLGDARDCLRYNDIPNRDHFAGRVFVFYDKNDPGRDHFLCYPGAWDGEIPSNYLIAEYRLTNQPVTAGISNDGMISIPARIGLALRALGGKQ